MLNKSPPCLGGRAGDVKGALGGGEGDEFEGKTHAFLFSDLEFLLSLAYVYLFLFCVVVPFWLCIGCAYRSIEYIDNGISI